MQVLYTLLGAFFTYLSLWILEGQKNKHIRKEKERNFILFIRQELISFSKGVDRLKNIFEQKNWFDLMTVDQLEKNLQNMESQRKGSIYLRSQNLQEEFADLITESANILTGIRFLESNYLETIGKNKTSTQNNDFKDTVNFINQRRTLKLIDLIEIQRKIFEYSKKIS